MITSDQLAVLAAIKDDSVVELLMREYQILQEKIDKIGEFRFTIKGWALTLDTGTVLAAFATSLDRCFAILLLLCVVLALWFLELRQIRLTEIFQNRAFRIEKAIMRRLTSHGLRRADVALLMKVPGIAAEIRTPLEDRAFSAVRRRPQWRRWLFRLRIVNTLRRSEWRRKLRDSDLSFYLVIWVIAALFLWFQHPSRTHVDQQAPLGHLRHISADPTSSRAMWQGGAGWRANED